MRRLAIFVEGYTELLFIEKLIREVAELKNTAIHLRQIKGGGHNSGIPKKYIELQITSATPAPSHYFLIVDCGGEDLVAQRIREEQATLTRSGYEAIIGIRDVYPKFTHLDIPKLTRGLRYGLKTNLCHVQFVLSVMELEAWFLAEHTHFVRVDPVLNCELIQTKLGFDPANEGMTKRLTPRQDLSAAYSLVAAQYIKGAASSTIDRLDFAHVYTELRERIPDLNVLISAIDNFIQPLQPA
jgi:hypothetical protein